MFFRLFFFSFSTATGYHYHIRDDYIMLCVYCMRLETVVESTVLVLGRINRRARVVRSDAGYVLEGIQESKLIMFVPQVSREKSRTFLENIKSCLFKVHNSFRAAAAVASIALMQSFQRALCAFSSPFTKGKIFLFFPPSSLLKLIFQPFLLLQSA